MIEKGQIVKNSSYFGRTTFPHDFAIIEEIQGDKCLISYVKNNKIFCKLWTFMGDLEPIEKCIQYSNPNNDIYGFLQELYKLFKNATRMGESCDVPEGLRYIQISDTLANQIASEISQILSNKEK